MEIKIKLTDGAIVPSKAHFTDAAYDIYASENCIVPSKDVCKVHTGISMEIPLGWYGDMRPRSSMFSRNISVGGTIDSGYRGEIMVMIQNHSDDDYIIHRGDRIAQMVIAPCPAADFIEVKELSHSSRGTGGFGSSGT